MDAWDDPFKVELDSKIVGSNPIGRATIECLRMNSTRQIAARQQWSILQLFP